MAIVACCGKCGHKEPAVERSPNTWLVPSGWLVLRDMPAVKYTALCTACVSDLEKWLKQ